MQQGVQNGHFAVRSAQQRLHKHFGAKKCPFCVCSLCITKCTLKWPFWTPSMHKMGLFWTLRCQKGLIFCSEGVHFALLKCNSAMHRLHTQNGAFLCLRCRFGAKRAYPLKLREARKSRNYISNIAPLEAINDDVESSVRTRTFSAPGYVPPLCIPGAFVHYCT